LPGLAEAWVSGKVNMENSGMPRKVAEKKEMPPLLACNVK